MNKDLISRQDAIKEVSKYVHSVDMIIGNGTLSMAGCRDTAEEILEGLPSIESEPKWIQCSERLPNHDEYIKNNGLFIVSDGNRSYSEWYDIYDKRRFGEPTMSGFRIDYAVTAWMPLPKPTGVMLSE